MTTRFDANPLLLECARRAHGTDAALPACIRFDDSAPPNLAELATVQELALHAPGDPEVRAGYAAFIAETMKQFELLAQTIEIEPWLNPTREQPYRNSNELFDDMRAWHLYFFTGGDMPADHPLAADSDIEIGGFRMNYNHVFRCVHDSFGHFLYSCSLGRQGEYRAWRVHSQMYSPRAIRALTTETLTQTAWYFAGPQGAPATTSRPYPAQKAHLTPAAHCVVTPLQSATLSESS